MHLYPNAMHLGLLSLYKNTFRISNGSYVLTLLYKKNNFDIYSEYFESINVYFSRLSRFLFENSQLFSSTHTLKPCVCGNFYFQYSNQKFLRVVPYYEVFEILRDRKLRKITFLIHLKSGRTI
uniref:Uncharacterized protein n=1 Tax=Marseillevirus LCMAC101 TaxID=2506602 RepID=A0A481YST6_9VIRU|nr:MAG: hypothetical protein LCMAC101_06450 [Marseillevirus LCMAC101]